MSQNLSQSKNRIISLIILAIFFIAFINPAFADSIDNVFKEGETILQKITVWVKYFIRIACTLAFIWNLYNYGKNNAPWESTIRWLMVILAIAASTEIITFLFGLFAQ